MNFNYKWLIANAIYVARHFKFKLSNKVHKDLLLMVVDSSKHHPGFLDILKGIVGCYYIAKKSNFDYRLNIKEHLNLEKYLVPNKVQWNRLDDVSYNLLCSRMLNYYGRGNYAKLQHGYQYHVYNFRGWNNLQRNNEPAWEEEWSNLFKELFTPSDYLRECFMKTGLHENSYISVHVRFVNAIEVTEPQYLKSRLLPEEEQVELINSCLDKLTDIARENSPLPVVVFSDSNRFLQMVQEKGFCVLPGRVGHVGYNQSDEILEKMFIDLYSIGSSKQPYCLHGNNLYNSVFPYYSSLIMGKKINIVNI